MSYEPDPHELSGREKARLMEQHLQVHNERRAALGLAQRPASIRSPWDRANPDEVPAPVFERDDAGPIDPDSRPPSWQRRAARYRDGLPPPPPPEAAIERQQILRAAERGQIPSLAPTGSAYAEYDQPPYSRQEALIPPDVFEAVAREGVPLTQVAEEATRRLSPSQKRRERRRRQREFQQPAVLPQQSVPAPVRNGSAYHPGQPVEPTHPEIDLDTACEAPITLALPRDPEALHLDPYADPPEVTLYCSMKPYPHIGQPHLVKLPPTPEAVEVFLGWFGPGE